MPHYTVTEEEIKANVFFDALKLNNKAIIQYTWDDRHFWRTTSGWGAAHLAALRVLVFLDLPMDRIIPAEFQVAQDPIIISAVKKYFGLSLDQVKAGRYDRLDPARTFYSELAAMVRVGKSPSPSHPMALVEDTREIVSNNLLVAFLSLLSDIVHRINDPTKPRPEFNSCPERLKFVLAGGEVTSENNGSGLKMRFSKTTNQWVRTGVAPISNVQVTPDYFESCDKGIIKPDQYFLIRRSRTWDLTDTEERAEAALAFLGVLKYTMSA